ncbi:hypothetical protein BDV3_007327 [Batrachochytrium dendrobatidis]|uniref:Protein kinase domain-containing protein n=2 Tax=Batrachochytrium dendrobatidis TaxID=109871 RepID=A0A177WPQ3_BATDL|nr:hypothetical protein BDEG_25599 [Batrachochytrium dendrobatidis JEL423]
MADIQSSSHLGSSGLHLHDTRLFIRQLDTLSPQQVDMSIVAQPFQQPSKTISSSLAHPRHDKIDVHTHYKLPLRMRYKVAQRQMMSTKMECVAQPTPHAKLPSPVSPKKSALVGVESQSMGDVFRNVSSANHLVRKRNSSVMENTHHASIGKRVCQQVEKSNQCSPLNRDDNSTTDTTLFPVSSPCTHTPIHTRPIHSPLYNNAHSTRHIPITMATASRVQYHPKDKDRRVNKAGIVHENPIEPQHAFPLSPPRTESHGLKNNPIHGACGSHLNTLTSKPCALSNQVRSVYPSPSVTHFPTSHLPKPLARPVIAPLTSNKPPIPCTPLAMSGRLDHRPAILPFKKRPIVFPLPIETKRVKLVLNTKQEKTVSSNGNTSMTRHIPKLVCSTMIEPCIVDVNHRTSRTEKATRIKILCKDFNESCPLGQHHIVDATSSIQLCHRGECCKKASIALKTSLSTMENPILEPDCAVRAIKMVEWAVLNNEWLVSNYHLKAILGYGGCGVVVSGYDFNSNKQVAIKIIYRHDSLVYTTDGVPMEIGIHRALSHENIVSSIAHTSDSRAFYLVMEKYGEPWETSTELRTIKLRYDLSPGTFQTSISPVVDHTQYRNCIQYRPRPSMLGAYKLKQRQANTKHLYRRPKRVQLQNGSGSSLADYISTHPNISETTMRDIFTGIVKGVQYLHKSNIIHGDIKEENVLVGIDSTCMTHQARLCDFGHSYIAIKSSPSMHMYGTKVFCPPELVGNFIARTNGKQTYPTRVDGFAQDVWALGLVLYAMVYGAIPDETRGLLDETLDLLKNDYLPAEFDKTVSEDCLDLIKRMLMIDPSKRITVNEILCCPWILG